MQTPHVAANAGNSQEAGPVIDQLFETPASNFFSRIR